MKEIVFRFETYKSIIEEINEVDGYDHGVRKVLGLWDIEKLKFNQITQEVNTELTMINTKPEGSNKEFTVVTGLWNIGRDGRDFTHYIDNFKLFLENSC